MCQLTCMRVSEEVMAMKIFCALLVMMCLACGGQPESDCSGVDTSQAPFRIQRANYPGGHYSETWYWTESCYHVYYY